MQQGQVLTGATGTWTGAPAPTLAYQWQRCDASGASCGAIGCAMGSVYALVASDVTSTIRFAVTGTNAAGSVTATSPGTAVVVASQAPPSSLPVTPILDSFSRANGPLGSNWATAASGEPS